MVNDREVIRPRSFLASQDWQRHGAWKKDSWFRGDKDAVPVALLAERGSATRSRFAKQNIFGKSCAGLTLRCAAARRAELSSDRIPQSGTGKPAPYGWRTGRGFPPGGNRGEVQSPTDAMP